MIYWEKLLTLREEFVAVHEQSDHVRLITRDADGHRSVLRLTPDEAQRLSEALAVMHK
jgi:hypothetical protein